MAWDPDDPSTVERFSRQLALGEVGPAGQAALGAARVLVVGAGGLAHPVCTYLAAAGVGEMTVLDADCVEVSNLPRQVLFGPEDVGRAKVDVLAARLRRLSPACRLRAEKRRFIPETALTELRGVTVAVDASDNFGTRFLLNDACRLAGVPLVHAGVTRFGGLVTSLVPEGPCYRCFFAEPPSHGRIPGCGEAGVIGPAVGVVAAWQALEVVKLIVGAFQAALVGRVLVLDMWRADVEVVTLGRDPACLLCGASPEIATIEAGEPAYAAARGVS